MSVSFNKSGHEPSKKEERPKTPTSLIPTHTKLTYDNLPDFLRDIEDYPAGLSSFDYHWYGPERCETCYDAHPRREGRRHYRQGRTDDKTYPVIAFWKCDNPECGFEGEAWDWYSGGKPTPAKVSKKGKKKEKK